MTANGGRTLSVWFTKGRAAGTTQIKLSAEEYAELIRRQDQITFLAAREPQICGAHAMIWEPLP